VAGAADAAVGGVAAGGGELAVAAELAAFAEGSTFEDKSRESKGFSFSFGGSSGDSGFDSGFLAISSDATISTAIGSAVTVPKGCTSAKKITSSRHDKCASADAVMPDRKICRGSTVLNQRFDAVPARV
jgi:hypothetical protein